MSLEHLDILSAELPELFQSRDLSPLWHEDLIIIPVEDPEFVSTGLYQGAQNVAFADEDEFSFYEQIGADAVVPGSELPDLSPTIIDVLGGAHSGAPVPYLDHSIMPPADCLAFYLPFHYYHPTWWGVYLIFEGVVWLAGELIRRYGEGLTPDRAMQAARLFLYYHEAFHHKTECFATRLELTHRKPFYKTGFERFYQKTSMTVDCLEEGLANASALSECNKKFQHSILDCAMEGYVKESPPGYDQGVKIRREFLSVRCRFAEANQGICLPLLPSKNPDIWKTAQHMFNGISNIKSRVNYVIPRSSAFAKRLPFRPLLPPSKLIKKLKAMVHLEFVRSGGNHDIYRTSTGHTVPIPRHPRDLGRGLLRKILREAGLDIGIEEFLQR